MNINDILNDFCAETSTAGFSTYRTRTQKTIANVFRHTPTSISYGQKYSLLISCLTSNCNESTARDLWDGVIY